MVNLAHRGASAYAPENTMAAFFMGLEMRASGIETDVRATSDGALVLLHDRTVDRTTDGAGEIAELSLAEAQRLDAGVRFGERYCGERIPLLGDFLRYLGRRAGVLAIEIKAAGIEADVLGEIKAHSVFEQATITAFEYETLVNMRRLDSRIRIGWLVREVNGETHRMLKEIGAQQVCPRADVVNTELVSAYKAMGYDVRAWGVKDEQTMEQCFFAGVDGMTVNFPDKLYALAEKEFG